MNSCAGSVHNALFARLLLFVVVVTAAACAKDETINNTSVKAELTELSTPVIVKKWYPTPRQLGGSTAVTRPPAAAEQSPVWTAAPRWPQTAGQAYSPWQFQQAPEGSAVETVEPAARRPWGSMDNNAWPSQRQQSMQVWQSPPGWSVNKQRPQAPQSGMYRQEQNVAPVYVW